MMEILNYSLWFTLVWLIGIVAENIRDRNIPSEASLNIIHFTIPLIIILLEYLIMR
jgi:hypothetical protein